MARRATANPAAEGANERVVEVSGDVRATVTFDATGRLLRVALPGARIIAEAGES